MLFRGKKTKTNNNDNRPNIIPQIEFQEDSVYAVLSLPCDKTNNTDRDVVYDRHSARKKKTKIER